jgi:hypothetical protein
MHHSPLPFMRTKTALTIGVIGTAGAISTYLYNKPTLRKKMMKAGSPQEAASVFAAEIEKDAADIAESVKDATMHSWLMQELKMGKDAVTSRFNKVASHAKKDAKAVKSQAKSDVQALNREKAHVKRKLQQTKKKVMESASEKVAA